MRPIVAIVGRPNVGKSTLFNKLVGSRVAIVEDIPGVTRDRIYGEAEWLTDYFTVIDTGGIDNDSDDIIPAQMRRQAELAMDTADVILFVVNDRDGVTPQDREIAEQLRRTKKPIVLAVNKVDNKNVPDYFYDFYELGVGEPLPISASVGLGIGDLLDVVAENFPKDSNMEENKDVIKVAIVGKPNAGKSSIINRILGEERVIVSPIAGTTRDAIDTYFHVKDQEYLFIDTAGIRKKSKIDENIEKYSVIRSYAAVERADVVLIVIDANIGISEQDSKIAGLAHNAGKSTVIVVNKWDLVEKDNKSIQTYTESIRQELPFMSYAPIIFVSTTTGQRFGKIIESINAVYQESQKRVPTGLLNDVIGEAVVMNQPPSDKGRRLKIYYATQVSVQPPTFTIFINDRELFHFSYQRYLENQIRENFGFEGSPVIFLKREKRN